MTAPEEKPPSIAPPAINKRRAIDGEAAPTVGVPDDDPERLYEELRAGKRNIQSLAPLIPLNIAFLWQAQRRLSDAEFAVLMADLDIQEVMISDLPTQKSAEPEVALQRTGAVVAAFNARMAGFEIVTLQEAITELDMKTVLQAKAPLIDGIGFRMSFAKSADDSLPKAGTPPQLTVSCRAYIASTSMASSVKCEAVFSAPGLERDLYCRVVVPLPIYKGGRRRLLTLVLDNETRQAVKLPPAVADIFHEKNLFDLRLLKKAGAAPGSIGSAVKGALGIFFNK